MHVKYFKAGFFVHRKGLKTIGVLRFRGCNGTEITTSWFLVELQKENDSYYFHYFDIVNIFNGKW